VAEEAKMRAGLKQIADLEKKLNEEGSNDFTPKAKAMSCSRVRSKCTALLNRSMEVWKGSGIGFSSCAGPNYLLSHARVFRIAYQMFGS